MKYIRTKNGIFRTTKNFVVDDIQRKYVAWHDFYEQILKEADTIEELCDEFVYENEKGNKIIEKILTFAGFVYATGDYEFKYGAIWTDKGLIYVAKMNSKGELELL